MERKKDLNMSFEEAVRVFSYGRAVVMFRKRLTADFWEKTTIRQQVEIYCAAAGMAGNHEFTQMILLKLASTRLDFSEWRNVYDWALAKSDLQALAISKMLELASTVEQWQVVYLLGPSDGDHKKIALKKIEQLAAVS